MVVQHHECTRIHLIIHFKMTKMGIFCYMNFTYKKKFSEMLEFVKTTLCQVGELREGICIGTGVGGRCHLLAFALDIHFQTASCWTPSPLSLYSKIPAGSGSDPLALDKPFLEQSENPESWDFAYFQTTVNVTVVDRLLVPIVPLEGTHLFPGRVFSGSVFSCKPTVKEYIILKLMVVTTFAYSLIV